MDTKTESMLKKTAQLEQLSTQLDQANALTAVPLAKKAIKLSTEISRATVCCLVDIEDELISIKTELEELTASVV